MGKAIRVAALAAHPARSEKPTTISLLLAGGVRSKRSRRFLTRHSRRPRLSLRKTNLPAVAKKREPWQTRRWTWTTSSRRR